MRRLLSIGMITILVLVLTVSFSFSQEKQGTPDKPIDDANYLIGPEDVLDIHVWKEDALTRAVPVRSDGMISLPLINEVYVLG